MSEAALSLDGLEVSFGGVRALRGVSLSVPMRSIYGIVGPNGSGKTTMLNAVSGFVPARGDIRILGRTVSRWPPHRRSGLGVGRTFQVPRTSRTLTVWELLRMGDHQHRRQSWWKVTLAPWIADAEARAARQLARETLTSLGLGDRILDARVQSLPQGTIKMLDVARALMANPTVLLLDEPTAGMSEAEIKNLRQRLRLLNDEGLTVVVIEHNIRFLTGTCDAVTVLHLGRKISDGTPDAVFSRPEVIEAYLGEAEPA